MKQLLRIAPTAVAYDLHPQYLSTKLALEMADVQQIGVQHHHAHIASCMAENGIADKVIGVALDGTGFGTDGKIWGGEFLVADFSGFERRADRVQALREARRVVRPGGPVFGAGISRWATRLDGMLRLRIYEQTPAALDLLGPLKRTGVMPPLVPGGFNGFAHRPRQLRAEFASAGLAVEDLVCVEGASFLLNDLDDRAADERAWQVILDSARAHERVPELMGLGSHLLATGVRR